MRTVEEMIQGVKAKASHEFTGEEITEGLRELVRQGVGVEESLPYLLAALEKLPMNIEVIDNVAGAYEALRDYDKAMFYFEKVLEQDPQHDLAWESVYWCKYLHIVDKDEALRLAEEYGTLLSNSEGTFDQYVELAYIHKFVTKNAQKELNALLAALDHEPNHIPILNELSHLYRRKLEKSDDEKGMFYTKQVLALDPENETALESLKHMQKAWARKILAS